MDHDPHRLLSRLAALCVASPVRVLLACLALVGLVNLLVPQLEQVVAQDSTPIVPKDAPAVEALAQMDRTFGNGRSVGFVFVVLERDGGLSAADDAFFETLLPRLRADTENVSFVQDVTHNPQLLDAVTSEDGEAVYVQVGLPGDIGAPSALGQIEAVRDLSQEGRPDGLNVAVTGPAATIADMSTEVEHSILKITFVTVGLIALIQLLILDEPTNGLDPSGIREIRETIRTLSEGGVTVLLSSHILAEVQQVCDSATIIGHGRMLASGKVEDLLGASTSYAVGLGDLVAGEAALTGAGLSVRHADGRLLVETDDPPDRITRALADAGLYLSELTPVRPDLESVFLELTESDTLGHGPDIGAELPEVPALPQQTQDGGVQR